MYYSFTYIFYNKYVQETTLILRYETHANHQYFYIMN
jgi:hypothetical protein